MTTLNAEIVISVADRASHVFARVSKGAEGFHKRMGKVADRVNRQTKRAGLAIGAGLAVSINQARKYSAALTDLGIVTGQKADELERIGDHYLKVSGKVNQYAIDLVKSANILAGKGLDADKIEGLVEVVGRAATATGASLEDLTNTTFSLVDNLKIAPEYIKRALDILAKGGKEGGFELEAMAKHIPSLSAAMRTLGMEGEMAAAQLTAALQVAMKGAGSENEAANNMQNFLAKLTSPETVKRFSKFGVSVEKVLADAAENGVTPFEAMIEKVAEITKGDPFKLGQLFGDLQVQNFLKPMLSDLDEYKRIRDEALKSEGLIDQDFLIRMKDSDEQFKRFGINMTTFATIFGTKILPKVNDLMMRASDFLDGYDIGALADRVIGVFEKFASGIAIVSKAIMSAAQFMGIDGINAEWLIVAGTATLLGIALSGIALKLAALAAWPVAKLFAMAKAVALAFGRIQGSATATSIAVNAANESTKAMASGKGLKGGIMGKAGLLAYSAYKLIDDIPGQIKIITDEQREQLKAGARPEDIGLAKKPQWAEDLNSSGWSPREFLENTGWLSKTREAETGSMEPVEAPQQTERMAAAIAKLNELQATADYKSPQQNLMAMMEQLRANASEPVVAEVTGPVTAELSGRADVRVHIRVDGGSVTETNAASVGDIHANVGTDTAGTLPAGY
ncbi:MAG: phage tail tape measure protein [Sneathiella sp.]|nr:MAG: phage tail tape measure protein [Sneathiella sp.]